MKAVKTNNIALATFLLDLGIPADTGYGLETPLSEAVSQKKFPMIQLLLQRGAQPTILTMIHALEREDPVLLKLLMKKGYKRIIGSASVKDSTLKDMIENIRNPEIIQILLDSNIDNPQIVEMLRRRQQELAS